MQVPDSRETLCNKLIEDGSAAERHIDPAGPTPHIGHLTDKRTLGQNGHRRSTRDLLQDAAEPTTLCAKKHGMCQLLYVETSRDFVLQNKP